MQPDCNIQEEEIRTEHCKQEEQTEDRLPNTIMTEENEENIPEKEVQIHVVQEERGLKHLVINMKNIQKGREKICS